MKLGPKMGALLLVDIQKGLDNWEFYGGNRNNLGAEKNASKILNKFRGWERPIFHIRHSSNNPSSPLHSSNPGFQIKEEVMPLPNEPLITKKANSAFIGTDLEQRLRDSGITTLIIVGLTTNHCIASTTRMASDLGFQTYLISDATATFDRKGLNGEVFRAELIHETCLANLNGEFARILSTRELLKSMG